MTIQRPGTRMRRRRLALAGLSMIAMFAALCAPAAAQPARVHRVGIVLLGGPYAAAVDGLREGLREHGFEEGKQYTLLVRDVRGDLKAVEAVARTLEEEKVDLIVAVTTSVVVAVKRATKRVPIVFHAGNDPVSSGLVASFAQPGGRLTGVHGQSGGLGGKRLELLKEMIPGLRRVVTFHRPESPSSQRSMGTAREAARHLKVDLVERPVASVEELHERLRALRPGEVDAFLYIADPMVASQADVIIDHARARRLPTMFQERGSVVGGALAAYGESFHAIGRLFAKNVHRVLLGADPRSLPVEQVDRFHFVVNLKTARALGLTIPPSVLARADEIIQ